MLDQEVYDLQQTGDQVQDILNKGQALPTNPELQAALDAKQDVIPDLNVIRAGAAKGMTAYQKPESGVPYADMDANVQRTLNSLGEAQAAASEARDQAQAAAGSAEQVAEDVADLKEAIQELPDGQAVSATVAEHTVQIAGLQQDVEDFESGEKVAGLADDLAEWSEESAPVDNQWKETIRSTAGEDPIRTDKGGVLEGISAAAGKDFKCTGLSTTGYNQLRLVADGGQAEAIGSNGARLIPVPHLQYYAFGDASVNNGMLFTGKPAGYEGGFVFGGSDLQPSVRFVPLADGKPTSDQAGSVVTPVAVTYLDKTYHTYTCPGAGWFIVSGITMADACAHLAWEDWYDRFVSPTDAADDGHDSIDLSGLFSAAPNGSGKFLYLSPEVFTSAKRTDATHMLITDPVGRVTSPSWTNTLQEDEETYLHELVISDMQSGGVAAIEGSEQILNVSGNTVSYSDSNATAISGAVRYQKATAATQSVTLAKTAYALNDCGLEIKVGAEGEAYMSCSYSQNIADALSQLAIARFDASMRVIAEALNQLAAENAGLRAHIQELEARVAAIESSN